MPTAKWDSAQHCCRMNDPTRRLRPAIDAYRPLTGAASV
jgi:hypothetical protein